MGERLDRITGECTYHQTSRWMLAPLSGMLGLEKEVQVRVREEARD